MNAIVVTKQEELISKQLKKRKSEKINELTAQKEQK